MKRFILQITVFFAIVALVDVTAGLGFSFLERKAKGGFTYRDQYICNKLETQILISGSSRCVRHYNPQIFTDSLGQSCYNSGQMGNGIILNYGRIKMIDERKKPKIIIYDLHPEFDLLVGDDNHRYLTWLKSHYNRKVVADIFESVDKTEKYKMQSKMYRYNSRIVELMVDYLHPISNARKDGFQPLVGKMDNSKVRISDGSKHTYSFDPLKLNYLRRMIDECEGSKLIFVVSPIWYGMDGLQFEPVKEMCVERNIPFYDFSNSPKYVRQDAYFKDGNHMNSKGADEFSKELVNTLCRDGLLTE